MEFLRMPAYQLFLHPITGGAIWGYVLALIYLRYVRRFPQYKAHFYAALAVLIYVAPLFLTQHITFTHGVSCGLAYVLTRLYDWVSFLVASSIRLEAKIFWGILAFA